MTNLILNVYKFILMKRLLFAGLLGVITSLGLRAGEAYNYVAVFIR